MIEKVHPNVKAGFDNFALFEIGKVHGKNEIGKDGIPTELGRVAGVLIGDYFQAKYFARRLYPENFEITYEKPSKTILASHEMASAMLAPLDGERSAVLFSGGGPLGVVGEFKPEIYKKFKLPAQCAGFELFLSGVGRAREQAASEYKPIPKYPATDQDISLKTVIDITYREIEDALANSLDKHSPKDVKVSIECIDIFAKDNHAKHTAFRLTAVSDKRTLTSEVMNKLLAEVEEDLKKTVNAQRI